MNGRRHTLAAVLSALLTLTAMAVAHGAPARKPTAIVVFGDSLSDTGNLSALTGGLIPPSPPYAPGRASNGPLWIDYVGANLHVPVANFAVSGALTGRGNEFDGLFGIDFPGVLDELDQFIASHPGGADPRAVYVVWAAANDFLAAPTPATIPGTVMNLVTTVGTLKAIGARHVLVVNMPDLGSSPEGLASGFSAQLTALSAAFNQALATTLATVESDVTVFDVFGLMRKVIADPADFGLTDVTTPCLNPTTFTVCVDPDTHLFWDTTHPTTRGHEIVANRIKNAIRKLAREDLAHR